MPVPYGATDGGKLVMRAGCAGGIYAAPTDGPLGEGALEENICLRIVRKSFILIL